MSSIERIVKCPGCREDLQLPSIDIPLDVTCPHCGKEFSQPPNMARLDPDAARRNSRSTTAMVAGIVAVLIGGRCGYSAIRTLAKGPSSEQQYRMEIDKRLVDEMREPQPDKPRRLKNGTLIVDQPMGSGSGEISITNTTTRDAIVILESLQDDYVPKAIFVRGASKCVLEDLPADRYQVFLKIGLDWDASKKDFTWRPYLAAFDDPVNVGAGQVHSLTIENVLGGRGITEVPEDAFPDITK